MTEQKLITIPEAVEELSMPPVRDPKRWLRRHLRQVEKRTGRTLLVRVGGGRERHRYRVDVEQVRVACPELFSLREQLARALADCSVTGRRDLAAVREFVEDVAERQVEIAAAIRRMEARLAGRGRGVVGREGG